MIGLIFAGIVFLGAYFIKANNSSSYIVVFGLATLGASAFNMLMWAFITDLIDHSEVKTGERNDATVYGLISFIRKVKLSQEISDPINVTLLSSTYNS